MSYSSDAANAAGYDGDFQCYEPTNFQQKTRVIIDRANRIIAEYKAQRLPLTLRQIYYQFVSRLLLAHLEKAEGKKKKDPYARLGEILADARMAGLVAWDAYIDLSRDFHRRPAWESPQEIVQAVANQFHMDWWADQPNYVEVWIEKNAGIGVIQSVCNEYSVPYRATVGCDSVTMKRDTGKRAMEMIEAGHLRVTILHIADHDPSGWQMTKTLEKDLATFTEEYADRLEVKRIALTKEQAEDEDNECPANHVNMAKKPSRPNEFQDGNVAAYLEDFDGLQDCWELDALEPAYLANLIRTEIESLIVDRPRWNRAKAREQAHRADLQKVSERWDSVVKFVKKKGKR